MHSRAKPHVDGDSVIRALGISAIVEMGAEEAEHGQFPIVVVFPDESGRKTKNLEEFLEAATFNLDEAERLLAEQKQNLIKN